MAKTRFVEISRSCEKRGRMKSSKALTCQPAEFPIINRGLGCGHSTQYSNCLQILSPYSHVSASFRQTSQTNTMSSGKADDRVGNVVDLKSMYISVSESDGHRGDSVVQVLQLGCADDGCRDFGFR